MTGQIFRNHRGNVVTYRLWNYDVDEFMPEREHETALENQVLDDINRTVQKIAIVGHASRTGSTEHNQELGRDRAGAIRDFLFNRGVEVDQMTVIAHGESPRLEDDTENDWERAVRIIIPGVEPGTVIMNGELPNGFPLQERPSDQDMYQFIKDNPTVAEQFMDELVLTYGPDMLNVTSPSGGGLEQGMWIWLELAFQSSSAIGLVIADSPVKPERLQADRDRILDNTWRNYCYMIAEHDYGFNESLELVDSEGQPVQQSISIPLWQTP